MTKQDILDYFKDINFAYNDCSRYESLERMLEELQTAQPEPHWIPVTEQLPHDEDNVLVTRYFTLPYLGESKVYWYVEQAEYCDGRWYPAVDDEDKVGIHSGPIAWMPLPQPYKGE